MSDFETEFARRNALSHVLSMARCLNDRHFPDMRRTAEELLIRHLPRLRPEDATWINKEDVLPLLEALAPARPALTLAILGAVGQVGDRRAISYVSALTRTLDRTAVARTFDGTASASYFEEMVILREAASNCLTCLRAHADRTKLSSGLLRGSQRPAGDQQSILLRAASKAESTASTELLRPDASPECRDVLQKEKTNDLPI